MLNTILLIILIIIVLGALPTWSYNSGWGYYPSGGAGLLLLIVVILLLADGFSRGKGTAGRPPTRTSPAPIPSTPASATRRVGPMPHQRLDQLVWPGGR